MDSGIDRKIYFILKHLYAFTEACVTINENCSSWFKTKKGVRQGDNLSPTLFSIFIYDLAKGLKTWP